MFHVSFWEKSLHWSLPLVTVWFNLLLVAQYSVWQWPRASSVCTRWFAFFDFVRDSSSRVIPWMPGMQDVTASKTECAIAAFQHGYPGFAMQAGSACFGSAAMLSTYASLGTSGSCQNGNISIHFLQTNEFSWCCQAELQVSEVDGQMMFTNLFSLVILWISIDIDGRV